MTQLSPASKTCAIVGGAGGIGTALCRLLLDAGWSLHVTGREADHLATLIESLSAGSLDSDSNSRAKAGAHPPRIATTPGIDARDPDAVLAWLTDVAQQSGQVDGLVNLAGSILFKPAHLTSTDDWNETIAQNLTTAFATVRAGAKVMQKAGGSIVLISSVAARVGLANHEAIAAAKAGVIGLTQSAAATYAPRNIRVNAVAPGLVESPMSAKLLANDAVRTASQKLHPLGRIGHPLDIAPLIAWLLSAESSWITGQCISVDGGMSTVRPRPSA